MRTNHVMQQGLESWLVTKDDVRLHLCIYKQQTLTKGNGAKSEGGKRARAARAKPLLYLVEEENLVWKRGSDQGVFATRKRKYSRQPWYLQRWRAWTTLREGSIDKRSGSLATRWWIGCCRRPTWMPRRRFAQRCRRRTSSRSTWPCWRYQCRGEPA